MPKYKKRKYKRKRKGRRRRYKRNFLRTRMGTLSGMPGQRLVCQRYADTTKLTSTSGVIAEHKLAANNVFDPLAAAGGHQPMGFDQMAGLYNHYVVLGSKLVCTFSDISGTSSIVVGAYLSDDLTTLYINHRTYKEAKRGQQKVIVYNRSPTYIKCKYSAKKFHGVKDVKDNITTLGAAVNANPTETAVYHIYAATLDGISTSAVYCSYYIDYIVAYSEPVDLAGS